MTMQPHEITMETSHNQPGRFLISLRLSCKEILADGEVSASRGAPQAVDCLLTDCSLLGTSTHHSLLNCQGNTNQHRLQQPLDCGKIQAQKNTVSHNCAFSSVANFFGHASGKILSVCWHTIKSHFAAPSALERRVAGRMS